MVGDGINDAPASPAPTSASPWGRAPTWPSKPADVTLMGDDLRGVATALKLSGVRLRQHQQNLFWAFVYNVIGIPIAAGILYPLLRQEGLLNPIYAAAAMAFVGIGGHQLPTAAQVRGCLPGGYNHSGGEKGGG